jgi:hypothetical protein
MVLFVFFLVIFVFISIVTLSCVSINKDATISGRVVSVRVPFAVHIFKIVKFSRLEKLLCFICYDYSVVRPAFPVLMPIILIILSVRVAPVILIWKSFSGLLLCSDHPFHRALEFFVALRVLFVEILKLPLGYNSIGESFNDFSFSDVVNLSTQLTKPSIIVPKTFASFLLESF